MKKLPSPILLFPPPFSQTASLQPSVSFCVVSPQIFLPFQLDSYFPDRKKMNQQAFVGATVLLFYYFPMPK